LDEVVENLPADDWQRIWQHGDNGGASVWRPQKAGYCSIGDVFKRGQARSTDPPLASFVKVNNLEQQQPQSFTQVICENEGSVCFHRLNCKAGYAPLGMIAYLEHQTPNTADVCCVKESWVESKSASQALGSRLWEDSGTGGADNAQFAYFGLKTFYAKRGHSMPSGNINRYVNLCGGKS
jgi:hypothetical protein